VTRAFRGASDGVDFVGDVNAAISANVGREVVHEPCLEPQQRDPQVSEPTRRNAVTDSKRDDDLNADELDSEVEESTGS
jgi:hypothetical protein